MIFTHNCYSFDTKPPIRKYCYLPPHSKYSVEQFPLPLVIGLNETGYTKFSHGHVCVFQPESGSDIKFPHQTLLPSACNTAADFSHIWGNKEEYYRS